MNMEHIDKELSELLPGICRDNRNVLITGNDGDIRNSIMDKVRTCLNSQLSSAYSIFDTDLEANEETIEAYRLAIEKADGAGVIIYIKELADFLYLEQGAEFEAFVHRISKRNNVILIAATRLASSDIITENIKQSFPVKISSQLTSGMNSRIVFGRYGAELLGNGELMVKHGRKAFTCML